MADRKFATWEWRGTGKVVKIEVRMRWGSEEAQGKTKYKLDDITKPENAPIFFIKRDDEELFIDLEHGNLTTLCEMLRDHLDAWYAIEWTDKLVVVVEASNTSDMPSYERENQTQKAAFSMTVEEWSEGTQTHTGDIWSRRRSKGQYGAKRYACNLQKSSGKPRPGRREGRSVLGIVDDTPKNRAALLDIEDRMVELFAKLQDFLTGDQLQTTITQAALQRLLPAADNPGPTPKSGV